MTKNFVTLVRSSFNFLKDEYGFTESVAQEDQARHFYGGYVSFSSPTTVIAIAIDRGVLGPPSIARTKDRGIFKHEGPISLDRIYEYAVTTPQDRSRLASHDSEQLKIAWNTIVEANRVNLNLPRMTEGDTLPSDSRLEVELDAYARLLRQYGEPFLRGDFSNWLDLHEYVWHWLVATEIVHDMRWGEELTVENVEARFGRLRVYLEALRHEYGNP